MPRVCPVIAFCCVFILPVNGKAQGRKPGHDQNDTTAQSSAPLSTPSAGTVINQYCPTPNTNSAPQRPDSYFKRLLSPENLPNIMLFFVGTVGVVVAVVTLQKIERQTKATEGASTVAAENMRAIVEKERARIRVESPRNNFHFLIPGFVQKPRPAGSSYSGPTHEMEIYVVNRGATTARDVKMSFTITITPLDGGNEIRETQIVEPRDIPPNGPPHKQLLALYGGIPARELKLIQEAEAILRISGIITYTDAFEAGKERTTSFSYEWKSDIEWHRNASIRTVSSCASDWYASPAEDNFTT